MQKCRFPKIKMARRFTSRRLLILIKLRMSRLIKQLLTYLRGFLDSLLATLKLPRLSFSDVIAFRL